MPARMNLETTYDASQKGQSIISRYLKTLFFNGSITVILATDNASNFYHRIKILMYTKAALADLSTMI